MFVIEEFVTTLVERILGFILIAFLVYLIFDQTALGQAGLLHLSSWTASVQGWVSEQHQQLGLGNLGNSAKGLVSSVHQHIFSSVSSAAASQ